MNKDIALYIDGKKIDWTKVPDILLTYQRTDYTNPTVTKNMFSKTVSIEGTPNNNNIFNHIWNLDRVMDSNFTLFNPSQRVSFELYNNAELVEKGYAKLDSINKDGYKIGYNITLYGGLGSFFYSLAYDINTDKEKTLADLNYMNTSMPDDEFDFEINKNTVWNAWDALRTTGHNTGSYKKWDYINFIPAYNGLPEDFDSDRALINVHGLGSNVVRYTNNNQIVNDTFPMLISDGEHNFRPLNGYVNAKMMRGCNETEMRDLRSYLQRPGLSIKGLFNAICNPINNGGYNVVLDSDFFSSGNPYYEKSWVTLPMLSPETDATDEYEEWDWYKSDQHIYTGDGPKEVKWKIDSINPLSVSPDTFQMNVEIHATIAGATADKLYTSTLVNNGYEPGYEPDPEQGDPPNPPQLEYYGCTAFQMYGFGNGSLWYSSSAKCGSNTIVLTSKLYGQYIGQQSINTWWGDRPYPNSDIHYNFGYWKKVSGSDYVWHNETDNTDIVKITMETNLMSEIPNIAIEFSNIMTMNGALVSAKSAIACDAQYYEFQHNMNDGSYSYWNKMSFIDLGSDVLYKVNGKMRSFQPVKKKDLLGSLEGTPCDWLLSYCKLFGLFIEKDKLSDTIYIKMRNNWYKDEVVDLEDIIDRSKKIDVTPLTFESKWYNFNYGESEGKFLERYKNDYAQDFGKQLIDTKYNFDADEVDLLEDNKFMNGLVALEKSNYYNIKIDKNGKSVPECLYNWCTVTYYRDEETFDTYMCLPSTTTMYPLNPNTPKEFYDFLPKLQLHDSDNGPVDGEGVLVFFNGIQNTGDISYWLTDDIDEMFIDSENPCWLQTRHEWNSAWTSRIAIETHTIPEFNRYVLHFNYITADWDFGYTKELYVPYYRYDVNRTPTLYENFWKSYIQDLYSVNTRKVDCNVALNSNDVYDFMKKFYWWDNCLWVCTKVTDFDIALDKSTLCSFTKVNDKNAYLEMPTFDDYFFNFYRIYSTGNVPAQGTDEERTVWFNIDSSSPWMVWEVVGYVNINGIYQGNYAYGQEINATFLPNYDPNPRVCGFVANNGEGQMIVVEVWQDGYEKEKYLKLDPNFVLLPKEVITPVNITVDSSANWFCTTGNWAILDTVYGNSGTTTISLSATTNDTGSVRVLQIPFNNADGMQATLTVKQKVTDAVILEQDEIKPVYTVPASGGNVHYKLTNDVTCQVKPEGNTGNFANASGLVTYDTDIQPSSGTNFWIHFDPNTGTVTRNASFYAYYVDEQQGRHSIWPTIVQLPLTQLASGNTVVDLTDKAQGVSTPLGASMPWTATTNNSWITLVSTTGSSSDTTVEYTVPGNEGSYRTGYIYVTYKDEMGYYCNETIIINQEGTGGFIVTPTAITVDYRGGSFPVSVSSNTSYDVSMSENWCHRELARDGMFMLTVDENEGYARTMNVNITSSGETKTVVVNQGSKYPDDYTLDYVPENIVFASSGGTIDVTIRSDSPWTLEEGSEMIIIDEQNEE